MSSDRRPVSETPSAGCVPAGDQGHAWRPGTTSRPRAPMTSPQWWRWLFRWRSR